MSGKLVKIGIDGYNETVYRHEKSGPPPYSAINKAVGGYIERVRVRYCGKIRDAYVDEEGIIKGLPPNYPATKLLDGVFKNYQGVLHGPVIVWVPDPRKKKVAS